VKELKESKIGVEMKSMKLNKIVVYMVVALLMAEASSASVIKERIVKAFNDFNGKNLDLIEDFYADNIVFVDPIAEQKGMSEVKKYYSKIYTNVQSIKFDFISLVEENGQVFGSWKMVFRAKGLNDGKEVSTFGSSHFKYNKETMKVYYHRDYYDMGEFIYQHIPVLSYVIKKVNKRLEGHE